MRGFGLYATFDFKYHLGVEGAFHQAGDANGTEGIYQRTYEIGPRYVLHYGRLAPYAKLMVGRGVFNFPPAPSAPAAGPAANLAYNLWAGGAGADLRVSRSLQVRADYEFQQWMGFPPHGLDPRLLTIGLAYRFYGR